MAEQAVRLAGGAPVLFGDGDGRGDLPASAAPLSPLLQYRSPLHVLAEYGKAAVPLATWLYALADYAAKEPQRPPPRPPHRLVRSRQDDARSVEIRL